MDGAVRERPYRNGDEDWRRVRRLLVDSHAAAPPSWNWGIRRWDGARFHREVPVLPEGFAGRTALWETAGGRLVGVVHPEGETGNEAFLELDPDHRHLQPAMLDWVEAHIAVRRDGVRVLDMVTWDYDLPRRQLLTARGYSMLESGIWLRRLRFGGWSPAEAALADGYRLRTTVSGREDAARMATLLNAAFNRSIHTAAEYATFMAESPSFRHDLNLVAVAGDGSFAAHVGVTLDEVNRNGVFEPVCTHPAHVRRGLARALLFEGIRRLRALDAATADVETGDAEAANAFYASCGFTEEYRAHTWRREWPAAG
jgi:GNAT superfamily N-acetyltransferase